ncbi:MAG: glycosyltransferase family 1 protein [Elusimicrobiales bacterium]|nr:glycosyltransferase family 1 protein [Elusimicrobiales bacterium]
MRVGVLSAEGLNYSFKTYLDKLIYGLSLLGVEILPFSVREKLPPGLDIVWDPSQTLPDLLHKAECPVIVTIQGDYELGVPSGDIYGYGIRGRLAAYRSKLLIRRKWRLLRDKCSAIITISQYARKVLAAELGFPPDKLHLAYHGVDTNVFNPQGIAHVRTAPYLLHVSHYKYKPNIRRKNLERIVQAYSMLPQRKKVQLKLVVSEYSGPPINIEGVEIITSRIPAETLVSCYRGAIGFVFPSLHEGFGVPILEAMACGCPVITSDVTACPEVAGDAAILVAPHSVDAIAHAMRRLIGSPALYAELREKGLARAAEFSWERSAQRHLDVFQGVIEGGGQARGPGIRGKSGEI